MMRSLVSWGLIVALLAIPAFLYVWHRYQVADADTMLRALAGESVPGMKCKMQLFTFDELTDGTIYYKGTQIAVHALVSENGHLFQLHSSSKDGILYVWFDDPYQEHAAYKTSSSEFVRALIDLISTSGGNASDSVGDCQPWWIPAEKYFAIPNNIDFEDATGLGAEDFVDLLRE